MINKRNDFNEEYKWPRYIDDADRDIITSEWKIVFWYQYGSGQNFYFDNRGNIY